MSSVNLIDPIIMYGAKSTSFFYQLEKIIGYQPRITAEVIRFLSLSISLSLNRFPWVPFAKYYFCRPPLDCRLELLFLPGGDSSREITSDRLGPL